MDRGLGCATVVGVEWELYEFLASPYAGCGSKGRRAASEVATAEGVGKKLEVETCWVVGGGGGGAPGGYFMLPTPSSASWRRGSEGGCRGWVGGGCSSLEVLREFGGDITPEPVLGMLGV